ncbi:hypothetical protein [Paraburkholderia strydomiana]|uniref:hypothetical protein n=1 Tax=Paraburkholderia strydomiana TaxID=1245417 RepID=UPI00286A389C|nr:hypothetical protein [Paraburkholderia strydomiana]
MGYKTYTLMTLLAVSNAAQAWQPLIYPIRSQTAYQRSVDSALCYASANKETKVNTVREAQMPPPKPTATKTSSTGAPSRPPLPPSTFSSAPAGPALPDGTAPAASNAASAPKPGAATASNGASATRATPASGVPVAPKTADAGHAASAALPPSAAIVQQPASEPATTASAAGASQPGTAALPPLPAPEPPMTRYWAAYGSCMQARGYVVAQ